MSVFYLHPVVWNLNCCLRGLIQQAHSKQKPLHVTLGWIYDKASIPPLPRQATKSLGENHGETYSFGHTTHSDELVHRTMGATLIIDPPVTLTSARQDQWFEGSPSDGSSPHPPTQYFQPHISTCSGRLFYLARWK